MQGELTVAGKVYEVTKAELHLPVVEEGRYLYLSAQGVGHEGTASFHLFGAELVLLESLDALDGQRLHVRPDGETYDDDTLGTDIIGMDDDVSFFQVRKGLSGRGDWLIYQYGNILIDFARVADRKYKCIARFSLAEVSSGEPVRIAAGDAPEAYTAIATADVTVDVDEDDPIAELR